MVVGTKETEGLDVKCMYGTYVYVWYITWSDATSESVLLSTFDDIIFH